MSVSYSGPERRRFKRIKVSFIVTYKVREPLQVIVKVGNKEIDALMLDLSEGGIALLTDYNIPKEAVLFIKFKLIDLTISDDNNRIKLIDAIGKVKYSALTEKGEQRLGIEFTSINEKDRHAIAAFVAKV